MSPEDRRERRRGYSRSPDRAHGEKRPERERRRDPEYDRRSSRKGGDREGELRPRRDDADEYERDKKRERSREKTRQSEDRYRDRSRHKVRRRSPDDSRGEDRARRSLPPPKRRRRSYSESRSPPPRRSRQALPSQEESMRRAAGDRTGDHDLARPDPPVEKLKPNFNASGLLAKEANTVAGSTTVLKYHEPPEARKPPSHEQWRMFIFKGDELLDTVHLFSRSCWLLGRDEKVTDLLLEHPSISKQHAVIQFRYIAKKNEYGDILDTVKPYLIDLESANLTRLNKKKIADSRFVELRDGDVMTFGDSTREYVLMLPPPDAES